MLPYKPRKLYKVKNFIFLVIDFLIVSIATYYWFYVRKPNKIRPLQEVLLFSLVLQVFFMLYHTFVEGRLTQK